MVSSGSSPTAGTLADRRWCANSRLQLACILAVGILFKSAIRRRLPTSPRARLRFALCLAACGVLALQRVRDLHRLRNSALRLGRAWLDARYQLARAVVAHRAERLVERALTQCAEHARSKLKDPAMPLALQRAIDHVMDGLLPDIKQESYRVLDEHLHFLQGAQLAAPPTPLRSALSPLSPRRSPEYVGASRSRGGAAARGTRAAAPASGLAVKPTDAAARSTPPPPPLQHLLRAARAHALHALWPHDRSMWSCLRSPQWWLLHILGVLPLVGPWWWLALASAVDKGDEYQLCQFIVALRCAHFVTLGVGAALYGCVQAYRCAVAMPLEPVQWHGVERAVTDCSALAPTLSPFAGIFWLAQLLIVLRAFVLLPYSRKKGQRVVERRERLSLAARTALAAGHAPPPEADAASRAPPGGVLARLGALDGALAVVTLLSAALAALLAVWASQPEAIDDLNGSGAHAASDTTSGAISSAISGAISGASMDLGSSHPAQNRAGVGSSDASDASDSSRAFTGGLDTSARQWLGVTLFWLRTAHGLLSFPYVLLRLPGASPLLTHARRTGYDRLGHCVPYQGDTIAARAKRVGAAAEAAEGLGARGAATAAPPVPRAGEASAPQHETPAVGSMVARRLFFTSPRVGRLT